LVPISREILTHLQQQGASELEPATVESDHPDRSESDKRCGVDDAPGPERTKGLVAFARRNKGAIKIILYFVVSLLVGYWCSVYLHKRHTEEAKRWADYMWTGKYDQAEQIAERWIKQWNGNRVKSLAYSWRAEARYGQRNYKGALADATRCIEMDRECLSARLLRSKCYRALGRDDAADKDLRQYRKLGGKGAETMSEKCEGIRSMGQRSLGSLESKNASSMLILQWVKLTHDGKHSEALDAIDSFLSEHPNSKDRYVAYAIRAQTNLSLSLERFGRDGTFNFNAENWDSEWHTDMCNAIRSAPSAEIATEYYWDTVSKIRSGEWIFMQVFLQSFKAKMSGDPSFSLPKVWANVYQHISKRIAGLPVKNVDPELVLHGAAWIEWSGQWSALWKRNEALSDEKHGLENRALISAFETFLRSAMEDRGAFAPVDRLRARNDAVVKLERKLRVDNIEMRESSSRLFAENVRLRSSLATKYGREFKEFDLAFP